MKKLLLTLLATLFVNFATAQTMNLAAKISLDPSLVSVGQKYILMLNCASNDSVDFEIRWNNGDIDSASIESNNFIYSKIEIALTIKSHTFEIYTPKPEEIIHLTANNLAQIDVTPLTGLKYLNCSTSSSNNIVSLQHLDLSQNIALKYLDCTNNKLTDLDLNRNEKLTDLYCANNQFENLKLSQNLKLATLSCFDNKLTHIDISRNTLIDGLLCGGNKIKTLDLSRHPELKTLSCPENLIENLDLSTNTKLTYLNCYNNKLESLDLSKNIALSLIDCAKNKLTSIDFSKNIALDKIYCSFNELTDLNVSKNKNLTHLLCSSNQLTYKDLNLITEKRKDLANFTYSLQSHIKINEQYNPHTSSIDLSHTEAESYVWKRDYDNSPLTEGTDYTISGGVTIFLNAVGDVYCEMNHSKLPDLTLMTTTTTIN